MKFPLFEKISFILVIGLTLISQVNAEEDIFSDYTDEDSIVLTPTRLEQHKRNVPAGVTVITSEKLKNLGIATLPEAIRLVPGMRVNQASGWDYRINFHGTNALVPRRMLVLIDGMSIYRYGFAQVDWNRLAIDIEDIERIEVTRSPSAVSHGSNAFQTVVNIITKHPDDVERIFALIESGSINSKRYYLRNSSEIGKTKYSISLSKHSDDGFDSVQFDNFKDPVPGAIDSSSVKRFLIRTHTEFNNKNNLEVRAGGIIADLEEEEADRFQVAPPFKQQKDWHIHTTYNHIFNDNHHIKFKAYFRKSNYNEDWTTCYKTAMFLPELRELSSLNTNLALGLLNGIVQPGTNEEENILLDQTLIRINDLGDEAFSPLCGVVNQDITEESSSFEIEDTYQFTDNFRINSGFGFKSNKADSETYTNGIESSRNKYLFTNSEYFINDDLVLNAGLIYEKASNIDDFVFNTRVGLNYHYSKNHTIRISHSSASRLPNILETDRNWNYYMREWSREFDGRTEGYFFLNTLSKSQLKPEKINAYEIGFFGTNNIYSYDIRFFRESLRNLISEKGTFFNFNLTNNSEIDQKGLEVELSYKPTSNIEFSSGYSYIDSEYTNFFEGSAYSNHAGFSNITYNSKHGTFALGYYGNSKIAGESFNRWDMTYNKSFDYKTSKIGFSSTVGYLANRDHAYQFRDDNRAINLFDDSLQFRVKLSFSY